MLQIRSDRSASVVYKQAGIFARALAKNGADNAAALAKFLDRACAEGFGCRLLLTSSSGQFEFLRPMGGGLRFAKVAESGHAGPFLDLAFLKPEDSAGLSSAVAELGSNPFCAASINRWT